MKNHLNQLILILLLVCSTATFAQLNGFQFRTEFQITEVSGEVKTDFQVLMRINTKQLLDNNLIQFAANDLRFSLDCDGAVLLNYFIEDAVPSTDTKIWINFPSIPANTAMSFYMFYGNSNVAPGSDFELTFPADTRFDPILWDLGVQTGTDFSWAEIPEGTEITLKRGTALQINARRIIINGQINGNGRGELRGLSLTAGAGDGGGAAGSQGNGGAGGGHGAAGGTGSVGTIGGVAYDMLNTDTAFMGSGGGAGGLAQGGNGGGAVLFNARLININENILLNGDNGSQGVETVAAGGGGAGGGARIKGKEIFLTSNIEANGGNSGQAFSNSNGGGGAGGRIKVFYEDTYNRTGTFSVKGGEPGLLAGGYGGNGTTYQNTYVSGEPVINTIGTIPFFIEITTSGVNDSLCVGDIGSIIAPLGFTNYNFSQVGVGSLQNGPSNSYSALLNNNDQFFVSADVPGCSSTVLSDTVTITTIDKTTADFTALSSELDWSFFNNSTGVISGYMWDFGDGNTSTDENPSHTYGGAGSYTVTLTTFGELPCANGIFSQVIIVTCTPPSTAFSYVTDEKVVSFNNESLNVDSVQWFSFDDLTFNTTEFSPTHTFANEGTYSVCLEVKNHCQTITLCKNVTVNCIKPVAQFNITSDELEISLNNQSTNYDEVFWSTDGFSSTFDSPTFSYADRGTYVICLRVANDCSADTICKTVTVNCAPPVPDFSYTQANATFRFTDLTNNAVSWIWSYGDGVIDNTQNPFHVFENLGDYLVCLTVYNACGDFFTKCNEVSVTNLSTAISSTDKEIGNIYPNPVNDQLHVDISNTIEGELSAQLFSVTGKLVMSYQLTAQENIIALNHLKSGVYTLKLVGEAGTWTKQIIKN
jgi:PKD repeat protein